jgi:hypothetical protein
LSHTRRKPKIKIDELYLLVTIYLCTKQGSHPTAEVLMELKSAFAPSLTRPDTLRTWLYRHKGRIIKRVNDHRPYRYEVNRWGERRIVFLVEQRLRKAILIRQLGLLVRDNMIQLHSVADELTRSDVKKNLQLFTLLLRFLKT